MVTSVGRRSGRAPSLGKPRQRPVRIGGQQTIARPLLHRRAPRRRIANLPTRVPARVTHNRPPPISAPRLRDTAHPHCPRRHGARRFQDARQPILQCRSSRQVRNPSEPPTHAAQHSLPPRKTGITLKDTGIRDEHGLEPIDGIFSSPEKSPEKRNNPRQQPDKTLTSSDMDVQQSMFRRANIRVPLHDDSIVDALLASDDEDTKTAPPPAGSMPEPVDALSARRSSVRPGRSSIFLRLWAVLQSRPPSARHHAASPPWARFPPCADPRIPQTDRFSTQQWHGDWISAPWTRRVQG